MKKVMVTCLIVFIGLLLVACGKKKASSYYSDIDDTISAYNEYLSYKKSVEANNNLSYDEEKREYRKIALLQMETAKLIEEIQSDFELLSEDEKEIFLNYISDNYGSDYDALIEWFMQSGYEWADLFNAMDNGTNLTH